MKSFFGNKPQLKKVADKVWLLVFDNRYDLTMTFCRYQEYYESEKFKGKPFSMFEFMRWYSTQKGKGVFTYTKDWNGFNIPSWVIEEVNLWLHEKYHWDFNQYDILMEDIRQEIINRQDLEEFYLIGVHNDDKETVNHEIAHGFYATNSKYKMEVKKLLKKLSKKIQRKMNNVLKKKGYHKNVWQDETHTFLATGLEPGMEFNQKVRKPFQKLFKRFLK